MEELKTQLIQPEGYKPWDGEFRGRVYYVLANPEGDSYGDRLTFCTRRGDDERQLTGLNQAANALILQIENGLESNLELGHFSASNPTDGSEVLVTIDMSCKTATIRRSMPTVGLAKLGRFFEERGFKVELAEESKERVQQIKGIKAPEELLI